MGHTYSSFKPINRVFREYLSNPLIYDIHSVNDPEFSKELLERLRKALNKTADTFVETSIATQLDMPILPSQTHMDIRSRLCLYYMKKIIFAICSRSYAREIAKIEPDHPEIARYNSIFFKLVRKTKSSRLDKKGRVIRRSIYSDKYLSETELERLYALYYDTIYRKQPDENKFDDEFAEFSPTETNNASDTE